MRYHFAHRLEAYHTTIKAPVPLHVLLVYSDQRGNSFAVYLAFASTGVRCPLFLLPTVPSTCTAFNVLILIDISETGSTVRHVLGSVPADRALCRRGPYLNACAGRLAIRGRKA